MTHMIETVGLENIFKLHKIFHENYYLKVLSWKAELSPPLPCMIAYLSGSLETIVQPSGSQSVVPRPAA